MILIADSGSTKTDWRLINEDGAEAYVTIGFNPYHTDSNSILQALASSNISSIKNSVTRVVFYGAGCSSDDKKNIVMEPLVSFFINATVEVEHDMLAAARATCGYEKGMVAILGTGSNSCLYDGKDIVENVTALGYVLGDYGAGVDIGKSFIKALLGKELPREIEVAFNEKYNLSSTDILDAVYKQPLPNRFLAGFSEFVYTHINSPQVKQIAVDCFDSFFKTNICKYSNYKNYSLHLIGSVAFVYQELIKEVAENYKVNIGNIIKQPIDNLVSYHLLK